MPPAPKNLWWSVFNNQISVAPVIIEAPTKTAAITDYFNQEAGGQVGSRAQTSVLGPYKTKAAATAAAANQSSAPPGSSAAGAAGAKVSSLGQIGSFFGALTQKNTWIRVAEVLLGAALLIIGLAKLASGTEAGKAATKIATKAALI